MEDRQRNSYWAYKYLIRFTFYGFHAWQSFRNFFFKFNPLQVRFKENLGLIRCSLTTIIINILWIKKYNKKFRFIYTFYLFITISSSVKYLLHLFQIINLFPVLSFATLSLVLSSFSWQWRPNLRMCYPGILL